MGLDFDIGRLPKLSPPAIVWLKAQSIGLTALVGAKLFTAFNPYFCGAIAATTYLTEKVALRLFHQVSRVNPDEPSPEEERPFLKFLEYGYVLIVSTVCLCNLVHLAFPTVTNLLQFSINYMLLRTAAQITYLALLEHFGKNIKKNS